MWLARWHWSHSHRQLLYNGCHCKSKWRIVHSNVCVRLADWLFLNVNLIGSSMRKGLGWWWVDWGLLGGGLGCLWFGGTHSLLHLNHITFDSFTCFGAIFGCFGVHEAWPSLKITSLDDLEPSNFDQEASCWRNKLTEKALSTYGKPFKGGQTKCGKYGHNSTEPKCPENSKKEEKEKRIRKKYLMKSATIATEKGIEFFECKKRKMIGLKRP